MVISSNFVNNPPMKITTHSPLAALTCLALASMLASPAWSQGTPSTQQMIEQLKAPPEAEATPGAPSSAPLRTRGLRNLSVKVAPNAEGQAAAQAAQDAAVAAPEPERPSLSLLIQFDFNSAKIRPESQPALQNLASALQSPELAKANFAVEGHTDAKGSADYNLKLSQSRAEAVQKFLAAQGVPATRLVTAGKGATELANPNDPLAAENRRVRIVNLQ